LTLIIYTVRKKISVNIFLMSLYMSASEKFFQAFSDLQNEENNYQDQFDAVKQLNEFSPENYGLQAFQTLAEGLIPHLLGSSLGGEAGSTASKVIGRIDKGDIRGAIKETTDAVGDRVQEAVQDVVDNVREQAGNLADAVQGGQTGLADALGDAANQATGGLAQVAENVTNLARGAGQSANDALQAVTNIRVPEAIRGAIPEIPANPLAEIEPTMDSPCAGVSRGLEALSGTARSQYQDILTGRGLSFGALNDTQQAQRCIILLY
jgi:hypothetical protein